MSASKQGQDHSASHNNGAMGSDSIADSDSDDSSSYKSPEIDSDELAAIDENSDLLL